MYLLTFRNLPLPKPPTPRNFCVSHRYFLELHVINIFIFLLLECRFSGKVLAALEINTTANQVYQLNFGDTKLLQKNIEVSLNFMLQCKCMYITSKQTEFRSYSNEGCHLLNTDFIFRIYFHSETSFVNDCSR